jgi:hypothetical protein
MVIILPSGEPRIGTLTIEGKIISTNQSNQPTRSTMKLDLRTSTS